LDKATLSIALLAVLAVLGAAAWFSLQAPRTQVPPMPQSWPLSARPLLSPKEMRAYRVLCDGMPKHRVLVKVPLLRFCKPRSSEDLDYWFRLLGPAYTTFAICDRRGDVVLAVDLEGSRQTSRRTAIIKRETLAACGVPYAVIPEGERLQADLLQALLPTSDPDARPLPQTTSATPSPAPERERRRVARNGVDRRGGSDANKSALFQDSFFESTDFYRAVDDDPNIDIDIDIENSMNTVTPRPTETRSAQRSGQPS
jgi:hypothetical protein